MTSIYGQAMRDKNGAVAKSLAGCVVFNIDDIATYYWQSQKTDWNVAAGDFPNIAPPYPDFFMQYQMPRGKIVVEEGEVSIKDIEMYGFAFHSVKLEKEKGRKWVLQKKELTDQVKWLVSFSFYSYIPSVVPEVYHDGIQYFLGVDEAGVMTPLWGDPDRPMLIDYPEERRNELENVAYREQLVRAIFSVLHPCLLAISFLHTKNTIVVENSPANRSVASRRRAARKSGEPSYTFHTLDIRPLREALRRESGNDEKGNGEVRDIARAAHLRRGHFADYQEGRGLFGRYHGLYWFDSTFVKGNGLASKDYNVHMPEDKDSPKERHKKRRLNEQSKRPSA
jgi:hypothetical protein